MKIPPAPAKSLEQFDDNDYFICKNQGELFNLAQNMDFDDDDFAQKYMTSDFCEREMDTAYSFFQMADTGYTMEYLSDQITPKTNNRHYDTDTVYWIGFMYRYLHIRLGIISRVIYKTLPFKTMLMLYTGMHTQDNEYVLDVLKDKFEKEE